MNERPNFYSAYGRNNTLWSDFPDATSITFDDIELVQQPTRVKSREQVDLLTRLGPFEVLPLISAPMDTVGSEKMVRALGSLKAIGTLPRGDIRKNAEISRRLRNDKVPFIASVGLKNAYDDAALLRDHGAQVILIDVANGGMKSVMESAYRIKRGLDVTVIAGNISTRALVEEYANSGIDIARVGIGSGSVCETPQVAGTGFPQLAAVFETSGHPDVHVISDGGIRTPGDAAKALAAGAHFVMMGSAFAGTDEAPGEKILGYKRYRGQASRSYMEDNGVEENEFRSAEGIDTYVKAKGPVKRVVWEFSGGIRSALSYSDAFNLDEFREKVLFNRISPATQRENRTHILSREKVDIAVIKFVDRFVKTIKSIQKAA